MLCRSYPNVGFFDGLFSLSYKSCLYSIKPGSDVPPACNVCRVWLPNTKRHRGTSSTIPSESPYLPAKVRQLFCLPFLEQMKAVIADTHFSRKLKGKVSGACELTTWSVLKAQSPQRDARSAHRKMKNVASASLCVELLSEFGRT